MLTFNAKAIVTKEHELEVRLPTHLDEGEYTVVIKVNEHSKTRPLREPLAFGSLHLGSSAGETFRREEVYGDDGR